MGSLVDVLCRHESPFDFDDCPSAKCLQRSHDFADHVEIILRHWVVVGAGSP